MRNRFLQRGLSRGRPARLAVAAAICIATAGCGAVISSATGGLAENLSAAILDQNDPEVVRDGMPAFLLLLDSLIRSSPDDPAMLGAGAELYAAYGILFAGETDRARTLTSQARDYGSRSLCAAHKKACELEGLAFDDYARIIDKVSDPGALFSYCVGNLAWIRANSADWGALARLPNVEHALARVLELGAGDDTGSVYNYLGILNTLRPPALGGAPERGREYFEQALVHTQGLDLSVKVEYARGYARLLYDRELHDRLLNEVLAADVQIPGYVLLNNLAQRDARELLASAEEYF
jgi:hypothetical protein